METSPRPGKPARRPHGRRAVPSGTASSSRKAPSAGKTPSSGTASSSAGPDLREAILEATSQLLAERSFADMAVSDILGSAHVSRGTFYFYFDSKQAVLAELVRRAVAQGHVAAEPWLGHPDDSVAALRAGITAGARLWQASAPVLRAIVENWRDDERLTTLWLEQMQSFTDATIAQINADPRARQSLAGLDIAAVASALTWLGERLYYLAATGTPPFDDQDTLVSTLLHMWTSALYRA